MKDFECATEDESLVWAHRQNHVIWRVLKNCLDILVTPITDKINISKETQHFTDAHIRPLVKNISS